MYVEDLTMTVDGSNLSLRYTISNMGAPYFRSLYLDDSSAR